MDGRAGAGFHVGVAVVGTIALGVAQLLGFTEMAAAAAGEKGARSVIVTLCAGSFLVVTLFSVLRHAVLMSLGYLHALRTSHGREGRRRPRVSVLVPALNEAGRIEKAIESVLAVDYPDVETIVIDDGSEDDTGERAERAAARHPGRRVKVLRKKNGGKWSALNLGFRHATGELILCVDADSQLAPDSLELLARHFDDPSVGGCAGQVRVRNAGSLITLLQGLEYVVMNALYRRAQSWFASVVVAPGPIAMFRRSVLEEVARRGRGGAAGAPPAEAPRAAAAADGAVDGPWQNDTFAEDADLTLQVLLTGKGVVYEAAALADTAAPTFVYSLLNQRYRWTRGALQAALKAWRAWIGAPGASRALPFWVGFLIFDTVAWPAVNLYGLGIFVAVLTVAGTEGQLLFWFLALLLIDLNAAAFSVRIEGASPWLILLSPLNRLYYNLLLDVSKVFALSDQLLRRRMTWS